MTHIRIILLIFALLPLTAQGQTWTRSPSATGSRCPSRIHPSEICYLVITSTAAADSPLFNVEHLADVCFDPKLDGTGTSSAQVAIRKCQNETASTNSCERVTVDVDGDGDVDDGILNGDSGQTSFIQRMCIYDLGPGNFFIEVAADPNAADTAVVTVTGH